VRLPRGEIRTALEQLQETRTQARLWATKTRSAIKREVLSLLSKVDCAEADAAHIASRLGAGQRRSAALQESRAALLEAMGGMVPRTELHEARAAHAACSAELERVSGLEARRSRELDALAARLQAAQNEADGLRKAMQVAPPGRARGRDGAGRCSRRASRRRPGGCRRCGG
jgi:chromosome segregation ATPase